MSHDPNDHPGVIALPPLIFAGILAIAIGLEYLFPVGVLPAAWTTWTTVLGGVIILAGMGLAIGGLIAFKRAGTNIEPRKPALVLVEAGPYRFTRNPMYIGIVSVMVGTSLIGSIDWGLPLAVILWLILKHGVVLREEAYLRKKFGAPYEEYLARSRRWF